MALSNEEWFGFPPPFRDLMREQKVDIIGGGSNVGKLGIQFVKLAGVGIIVAIASLSGEQDLKEMGATHVVDRHSIAIAEESPGYYWRPESVTHIYDCVNFSYDLTAALVPQDTPSKISVLHTAAPAVAKLKELGKEKCAAETVSGIIIN